MRRTTIGAMTWIVLLLVSGGMGNMAVSGDAWNATTHSRFHGSGSLRGRTDQCCDQRETLNRVNLDFGEDCADVGACGSVRASRVTWSCSLSRRGFDRVDGCSVVRLGRVCSEGSGEDNPSGPGTISMGDSAGTGSVAGVMMVVVTSGSVCRA